MIEKKEKRSKRDRTGVILPLAVLMVVILAIIGVALIRLGFHARMMAVRATSNISARVAADAGIVKALHEMNQRFVSGPSWDNSWIPYSTPNDVALPNSYASYSFNITGPTNPTGPFGAWRWEIVSTGKSGQATKIIHATVRFLSLFEYALIVTDTIWLRNSILIDGYDSRIGPYNAANPSKYLKIGTNSILASAITLQMNATVKGDVLVGVGGDPDVVIDNTPGGIITGEKYNMPWPFEFDPIIVPDCGISQGILDSNDSMIGAAGSTVYIKYDGINIPSLGVLEIVGDVEMHITGDMILGQGAELRVTPGSSLVIYLDGALEGKNSNGINNETLIPGNFILFGTGNEEKKWEIKNSGQFYGVYYAPNADIDIFAGGSDIHGSVSGLRFELDQSSRLHYDIALSELIEYMIGFGLDRWWEE